jgi:hypothetical protein
MRLQLITRLLLVGLAAGGIVACGGGSSSSSDNPSPNVLTGTFIDSAVGNIGYRTETRSGTTNSAGEFRYLEGETVVFFIGDLELPPVEAKMVVTPLEIAQTDDVNNRIVINLARLLQSLDEDGDPSNGITIPANAATVAVPLNFDQPVNDFEQSPAVSTMVANSGSVNTSLKDAGDAVAHLSDSLDTLNRSIIGAWRATQGMVVLTFMEDGSYVHVAIGEQDEDGQSGMERGTYTWDAREARLKPAACPPSVDQNGHWGLSDGCPEEAGGLNETPKVVVTGDTLTINDSMTFKRIVDADKPQVGAWSVTQDDHNILIVMMRNGRYLHMEDGASDIYGQTGVENGSYTWNTATGAFTTGIPSFDRNGEWGLGYFPWLKMGGGECDFYEDENGEVDRSQAECINPPHGGDYLTSLAGCIESAGETWCQVGTVHATGGNATMVVTGNSLTFNEGTPDAITLTRVTP